ncbi:MAG: hypothetical protein JHC33_05985 [Ignisphaera sp.]|nr:hypothetical protein [Ignisphaera sp.]
MTLLGVISSFLNASSCDELFKQFFIEDIRMFVEISADAISLAQKIKNLSEHELADLLVKADDKYIAALLIILTQFSQHGVVVNRLVHKVVMSLQDSLNKLSDLDIVTVARALGVEIEYKPCALETHYIVIRSANNAQIGALCFNYRMPLYHYLKLARTLLTEESWKLVAFPIAKGFIYVDNKVKIVRLIAEYLRHALVSKISQLSSSCMLKGGETEEILRKFEEVLEIPTKSIADLNTSGKGEENADSIAISEQVHIHRLKELFANIKSVEELVKIAEKYFPPCINNILNLLLKGENLTHHQRFALATFLINLNIAPEVIIDLFRHSPDFNEKITRYQIEHLQGLRGSRKKYLPYSCATMKTLNMCKWDCGVKNPLAYPYKMIKLVNKNS